MSHCFGVFCHRSYHRDVNPEPNAGLRYIRDDMGPLGYSHLLAIGSLDGLVEASRQSKVCAGTANEVSCAVFRVLMEEYGTGRYSRKHSTFYKTMMQELGLNTGGGCISCLVMRYTL